MTVPATAFGVGVFLVLVLPGIVFGLVRASASGALGQDKEWGARILQALLVSVLFDAIYLLILGGAAVGALADGRAAVVGHPRMVALATLTLGIAVPAASAYLIYAQPRWVKVNRFGRLPIWLPQRQTNFHTAPTAWDHVAKSLDGSWVRIRFTDGNMIAGWFGGRSYISTYPEARDIYIEAQHHLDSAGRIGDEIGDTAGVWVALRDGDIVEWINPEDPA